MKMFIATPIAGFGNENQMVDYKKSLMDFFSTLEQYHDIYSEILRINGIDEYDSPELSVKLDFSAIDNSDVFILHYPKKIVTSALIELGYAIAKNKRVIIIVQNIELLPYLGQGLHLACNNVSTLHYEKLDINCASAINDLLSK